MAEAATGSVRNRGLLADVLNTVAASIAGGGGGVTQSFPSIAGRSLRSLGSALRARRSRAVRACGPVRVNIKFLVCCRQVSPDHGAVHAVSFPRQDRAMQCEYQQATASKIDGDQDLAVAPATLCAARTTPRAPVPPITPPWTTLDHLGPPWAARPEPPWTTLGRNRPPNPASKLMGLIRDTPPEGAYVLNMFWMRRSRMWPSRWHRACAG